jgi:cell division protein FtsA
MEELFELVRQELERSGYYNLLPAGLVLSGGGAQMVGARELCEHVTGLPTRIGAPRDVIGLPEAVRSPVYATGVGLVMYGARHMQTPLAGQSLGLVGAGPLVEPNRYLGGFMKKLQSFFARVMGSA